MNVSHRDRKFEAGARKDTDERSDSLDSSRTGQDLISQETERLAKAIGPHVDPNATAVLMRNGVQNKELVQKNLPESTVLETAALSNALYVKEGKVTLTATRVKNRGRF